MVRVVGATGNLVEEFAFWKFDFMRVEIVFCFEVAQNEVIVQRVRLSFWIDLVQRFVEDL